MGEPDVPLPDDIVVKIDASKPCVKYKIGVCLGDGGFGEVRVGTKDGKDQLGPPEAAVKFERKRRYKYGTPYEWEVYSALQCIWKSQDGLPTIYGVGSDEKFHFMVMDRLEKITIEGDSDIRKVACQAIDILQKLHSKGYVHGDVKPRNLLFNNSKDLVLVDFGLASRWKKSSTGRHVEYDQRIDHSRFRGTKNYASVHALVGRTVSRRDDLISLAYSLIFLKHGKLPWESKDDIDYHKYFVCKKRMERNLYPDCPEPIKKFVKAVVKLRFDGDPEYDNYKDLFKDERHETMFAKTHTAPITAGQTQWITISNVHLAMKQRYHYNVEAWMLDSLIEKGKEEKVYISSVASCKEGWTLIIDESIIYTEQEYKRESGLLDNSPELDKWVKQKWKDNFYITALGAHDGYSLVVMSAGSGFNFVKQTFKTEKEFPYQWIHGRWKDGYFITALATSGYKWTVVMSRYAGFLQQVVEFDVCFPAEAVCKRWSQGYRITAVAASQDKPAVPAQAASQDKPAQGNEPSTKAQGAKKAQSEIPGQVAVVMSVLKRNPAGEKQVMLGTSHFPKQEIKEYWSKAQYVTSICYGSLYFGAFNEQYVTKESEN